MKKGIVLEHHRKYSIILTRDGSFKKVVVLDENVAVGEEVSYKPYKGLLFSLKRINVPFKTLSMVCIVLLVLLPLYFFVGKKETYAYITVDINPSIEMEIDEEFNVQHIKALNEDASLLLSELTDVENENIEIIIGKIINKSEHIGMFNDDKSMLVGISYTDAQSRQSELFTGNLKNYFSTISGWEIAAFIVPEKIRKQAKDNDISMNKVMAQEILQKDSDSIEEATFDPNDKAIINSFYNTITVPDENEGNSSINDEEVIITPVTEQNNKRSPNQSISTQEKQPEKEVSEINHQSKDPNELKGESGKTKTNANSNANSSRSENKAESKKKIEKTKFTNDNQGKGEEKRNKDNNGQNMKKDKAKNEVKDSNENNGKGNNKYYKDEFSNSGHGKQNSKEKYHSNEKHKHREKNHPSEKYNNNNNNNGNSKNKEKNNGNNNNNRGNGNN
ncbi:anti-sigma-I factor RsgI family protein [Oceanobacillus rekensis]|uniref:anti-sigma-I factor RsgI family protein n=1 Tax=Oceanobacillus rekensis TaxID=937927 RepID=UPI000B42FD7F|nr:anti-sigma factor domain-containing protein [Oceanobacillus rekensis]